MHTVPTRLLKLKLNIILMLLFEKLHVSHLANHLTLTIALRHWNGKTTYCVIADGSHFANLARLQINLCVRWLWSQEPMFNCAAFPHASLNTNRHFQGDMLPKSNAIHHHAISICYVLTNNTQVSAQWVKWESEAQYQHHHHLWLNLGQPSMSK